MFEMMVEMKLGELEITEPPILHALSAGSIDASEGQNGIWHKK